MVNKSPSLVVRFCSNLIDGFGTAENNIVVGSGLLLFTPTINIDIESDIIFHTVRAVINARIGQLNAAFDK